MWNPHHQALIEKLEKVQKRATKLVIAVKKCRYEERLKKLNLPTLKFRRIRRDMIEVYKIFSGKYDATVTSWLTDRHLESHYDLRGHRFSLYESQIYYDTRNYNFTHKDNELIYVSFYRAILRKCGLCCHAVSVCLSVCHVRGSRRNE